jgi:hypothetical protein
MFSPPLWTAPLAVHYTQMAIPWQGSAAASWPQPSVSRAADAAPTACRVVVQIIDPVPLPPRFSSLPRATNTNALPGRVRPKRALTSRAPTGLRGVAEGLYSPRDHRLHLVGAIYHVPRAETSRFIFAKRSNLFARRPRDIVTPCSSQIDTRRLGAPRAVLLESYRSAPDRGGSDHALKSCLRRAGLGSSRFHALRHTFSLESFFWSIDSAWPSPHPDSCGYLRGSDPVGEQGHGGPP